MTSQHKLRENVFFEVWHLFELRRVVDSDVASLGFAVLDHVLPDEGLLQGLRITHDHQEVLWTSDGNVQSSLIEEET